MGAGWQNWLWAFQIGMETSLASGLLAVYILGGGKTHRREWLAGALGLVAVASSGVGVAVLVGLGFMSWFARCKRTLATCAAIAGLYGMWTLAYGESQAQADNLKLVPSFVSQSAASVLSGLANWDLAIGGLLAGGLTVYLVQKWRFFRRESLDVLTLVVVAVIGWALSAVSRAHLGEPGASRYVHVGLSLLVPIVFLVLGTLDSPKVGKSLALVVAAFCIIGTWSVADSAGREFRERSQIVRAELTAMQSVEVPISPDYRPDTARAPQISLERFRVFAENYSTPLMSRAVLRDLPETVRIEVDRVLFEATGSKLAEMPEPVGWDCSVVEPGTILRIAASESVWLEGFHSLEIRRFADSRTSLVPATPGAPSMLTFGKDSNLRRWAVAIVAAGPTQVCRP
jgi:hypothetical protein